MTIKLNEKNTPQEWQKFNHEQLQKFLDFTTATPDTVTDMVKATMCQFLLNTRIGFNEVAQSNKGQWLNREQIISVQIKELRHCIIDLQDILTQNGKIQ